jgi:hypothetical protein
MKDAALDECGRTGKPCPINSAVFCRWVRPARLKPSIRNQVIMRNTIRYRIEASFCIWLAFVIGPAAVLAQSGSAGGSIGNDDKSLSGSRSEPSSNRGSDDEGVNKFDGTWAYNGSSTNCGGSGSGFWVISGGLVTGKRGIVIGRISPDGAYHSTSAAVGSDGVPLTTTGRMSGNSGGGSFRRADGCVGRWTARRT